MSAHVFIWCGRPCRVLICLSTLLCGMATWIIGHLCGVISVSRSSYFCGQTRSIPSRKYSYANYHCVVDGNSCLFSLHQPPTVLHRVLRICCHGRSGLCVHLSFYHSEQFHQKRREIKIDFAVGLGLPALQMILGRSKSSSLGDGRHLMNLLLSP